MQQPLRDLPLKMYQEYERVLKAMHAQSCSSQTEQTARYARKILLWLTTATRPLLDRELSDAASIGETPSEASFGRPIRNTAAFLKTCGSFITVKPTGHIALAHLSVKVSSIPILWGISSRYMYLHKGGKPFSHNHPAM